MMKILMPHIEVLVQKGLKIYPSMAFKSPTKQQDVLDEHAELLSQLLDNDPRGGHYDNHDIAAALRLAVEAVVF